MPLVLVLTLTACQTTGSAGIKPSCAGFQPITWSKADTPQTVAEIKRHNAFGVELCKWKTGR